MKFIKPFSDEQRDHLHCVIRESATFLDKPAYTFTSKDARKKEEGAFDLTIDNFFDTDIQSSFRCLDTFCDYIIWLDYDEVEPFKKLFELMNDNVAFDVSVHSGAEIFETYIHYKDIDEPEYLDNRYHPALHTFLEQYLAGEINIKVSADDLLKKIAEHTNYVG